MAHTLSEQKKIWMWNGRFMHIFHMVINICGKPVKSRPFHSYQDSNYGKESCVVALNSTLLGGVR